MHSSTNPPVPLPASGPKLESAIVQAIMQLEKLAARRDFDHEGWPEHAKVWRELLSQSKDRSNREVAPNILKGDLAALPRARLNSRSWQGFEKWFDRYVAPELAILASDSGIPALKAVRHSNQKGGRPEHSESIYFLAYMDQPAMTTPRFQSREIAASVEQDDLGCWVQRRWRFGVSMGLLGLFLLGLCTYLPADGNRPLFVVFSVILAVVGLWDMDGANKGFPRKPIQFAKWHAWRNMTRLGR